MTHMSHAAKCVPLFRLAYAHCCKKKHSTMQEFRHIEGKPLVAGRPEADRILSSNSHDRAGVTHRLPGTCFAFESVFVFVHFPPPFSTIKTLAPGPVECGKTFHRKPFSRHPENAATIMQITMASNWLDGHASLGFLFSHGGHQW